MNNDIWYTLAIPLSPAARAQVEINSEKISQLLGSIHYFTLPSFFCIPLWQDLWEGRHASATYPDLSAVRKVAATIQQVAKIVGSEGTEGQFLVVEEDQALENEILAIGVEYPLLNDNAKHVSNEELRARWITISECPQHTIKGDVRGVDLLFTSVGIYKECYVYRGKAWDRYHWETMNDPEQLVIMRVVRSGIPISECLNALEEGYHALRDIEHIYKRTFLPEKVRIILWNEAAAEGGLDLPPILGITTSHISSSNDAYVQISRPDLADLQVEDAKAILDMETFLGKKLTRHQPNERFRPPVFVVRAGRVVELDFPNCGLIEFPRAMSSLTALELIDARKNHLKSLPNWISDLTSVQQFLLMDNAIRTIPPSIRFMSNLKILDLTHNIIEELPVEINQIPNLESLVLSSNKLKSLPDLICQMPSLQVLTCVNLNLTSLPENIGNLEHLENLRLRENHLTTLPESIGNLGALTQLSINNNDITSLPESIGCLKSLTSLGLSYNPIASLPESFGNLLSLKNLDLSHSKITTIPESFSCFQDLEFLDIRSTLVRTIPPFLKQLPKLKELWETTEFVDLVK